MLSTKIGNMHQCTASIIFKTDSPQNLPRRDSWMRACTCAGGCDIAVCTEKGEMLEKAPALKSGEFALSAGPDIS